MRKKGENHEQISKIFSNFYFFEAFQQDHVQNACQHTHKYSTGYAWRERARVWYYATSFSFHLKRGKINEKKNLKTNLLQLASAYPCVSQCLWLPMAPPIFCRNIWSAPSFTACMVAHVSSRTHMIPTGCCEEEKKTLKKKKTNKKNSRS